MSDSPEAQSGGSRDFFGRFRLRLDAKGRLTLPSLYRRALAGNPEIVLVLRQGGEAFLQLIGHDQWKAIGGRSRDDQELRGAELQWQRRTENSRVEVVTLDPKGRLTLPQELLERNGIGRDVLVLGVGRIMELWDPATYFELEKQHEVDRSEVDDLLYE